MPYFLSRYLNTSWKKEKNLPLTIIQKSCMHKCLSFQTNVSHLFESHTGNRVKPRDEFHALTGKFWKEGWGYKQSCSSSARQSCHENSPVQTERLKHLQIHPLCENSGSLWQKKKNPTKLTKRAVILLACPRKQWSWAWKQFCSCKTTLEGWWQNLEFGITRSIMLPIFINPKDILSKGIFQGHLPNTEGSHLQDDTAK